jgi:hypothetical protein
VSHRLAASLFKVIEGYRTISHAPKRATLLTDLLTNLRRCADTPGHPMA